MGNCCSGKEIDWNGEPTLFHFSLLRNIGKGAFGKVRVVRHKKTHETYALKYIEKKKCVKMKAVLNIIQERRLLEEIDHPFVVNLRYAFQDDENCFFVLDLMLGGDLRFHLERSSKLPEPAVRFWAAELSCALAYLHARKIVHRDLKPDNILLDAGGHAHLTDFNIAVHIPSSGSIAGVAGSMAYMAPEVLNRQRYNAYVDWHSLGVCMYELLFGKRPFRGATNEELRQSINAGVHRNSFPEDTRDEARDALSRFMDKTPGSRLGARTLDDVRRHPWFGGFEWDALEAKEVPSPWVPDPNKANFDATYDLEELLLEDNPLRARERKVQDIEGLSTEMRQLEEQFTPYDFQKMNRRSYYPQNQITSSITGTSSVSRPGSLDAPRASNGYQGDVPSHRPTPSPTPSRPQPSYDGNGGGYPLRPSNETGHGQGLRPSHEGSLPKRPSAEAVDRDDQLPYMRGPTPHGHHPYPDQQQQQQWNGNGNGGSGYR